MIKTMQKRIEEIKQADRKAYYELANEIGISEYSLYNFMINKYSTNTEEKISKFLKDYKTKDEQIAQWKHEYEVLDACCELVQGKLAELKAENDRLNKILQEIKKIAETELSYDMVGNEHRHYKNYDVIRQLIIAEGKWK